jgi:hypothetical protein
MSPRRDGEELDRLGAETKARLEAYVICWPLGFSSHGWPIIPTDRQAQSLQSGLLALLERVDKVREEHDKLEGENRFLQEYDLPIRSTFSVTTLQTDMQILAGILVPWWQRRR